MQYYSPIIILLLEMLKLDAKVAQEAMENKSLPVNHSYYFLSSLFSMSRPEFVFHWTFLIRNSFRYYNDTLKVCAENLASSSCTRTWKVLYILCSQLSQLTFVVNWKWCSEDINNHSSTLNTGWIYGQLELEVWFSISPEKYQKSAEEMRSDLKQSWLSRTNCLNYRCL